MIKKASLLFNTVKHLKPIQVFYQLKYRLKKAGSLNDYNKSYSEDGLCLLSFTKQPPVYSSYLGENKFIFLNQEVQFDSEIDWNYQENGKLWNYNLQYANWLLQEDVSYSEKIRLLESLYKWLNSGQLTVEQYPVSLRAINVMRLFSHENKRDEDILSNTHAELDFLSKRPEYHLLGNHLLENAFALMMGGAFFSNKEWTEQGQSILEEQLEEQILSDGAHFELSPMYHQIIFFRLLELINWYSNWTLKETSFETYLKDKATLMLAWLKNISFENGDIPHFNDSAEGISYSTEWLSGYALKLGVQIKEIPLSDSGYRSVKRPLYECKIDFAQLGPSYQPGHAHADALSFVLNVDGKPVFVERGISTYEPNKTRQIERSTESHNTVVINNQNQSQVYGGFRVGNRGITQILDESDDQLIAMHNGYEKTLNTIHKREFKFSEQLISITDKLDKKVVGDAYFHFHPDIYINENSKWTYLIGDIGMILFDNAENVEIYKYQYSLGYNETREASALRVQFKKELSTEITIHNK